MNYKKGDLFKVKGTNEVVFYVDHYIDENNTDIIVCGGSCNHFAYFELKDLEPINASNEEKMINLMTNISSDLKNLNYSIEEIRDMFIPTQEEDFDEDGEPEDKTKLN